MILCMGHMIFSMDHMILSKRYSGVTEGQCNEIVIGHMTINEEYFQMVLGNSAIKSNTYDTL
jgi:hypothetical protein